MIKELVMKEIFLISTVNITANETGVLLCNASNYLGSSSSESMFLLTGMIFMLIL